MGYRAHIQVKHEIKYGGCHFNWDKELIADWLEENGVRICGHDEFGDNDEWEFDKDDLRKIPDEAFKPIRSEGHEIDAEDLRDFVRECLDAPTGGWAYVSWF